MSKFSVSAPVRNTPLTSKLRPWGKLGMFKEEHPYCTVTSQGGKNLGLVPLCMPPI